MQWPLLFSLLCPDVIYQICISEFSDSPDKIVKIVWQNKSIAFKAPSGFHSLFLNLSIL